MADLTPRHERLLARLARTQRLTPIAGAVLLALGIAYAGFGLARFDVRGDPRESPGFDGPVAELAFFHEPIQSNLERAESVTLAEARLRTTLEYGMRFHAGLLMLLMRLFLGTLLALAGLVMMTVAVERGRLLRIVERLREPA